jgi:PAS domain-containing protein
MLESVLSIAGATMALFGLFVLVDLALAARLAPERQRLIQLVAFLALALVSLGYNTQVRPGVIVDARGAVIAAATVFGGAPVGALVAGAAAIYRIILGGAGTWAGVAGSPSISSSPSPSAGFSLRGVTWRDSPWPFVGAGAAAAAGEASSLLAVPPWSEALALFRNVAPTLALVQLVTTVLIGGLGRLLWERRKDGLERAALAQRYALLAKYASDAIVLADASGRILEANRRACQLYGYGDDEIRSGASTT